CVHRDAERGRDLLVRLALCRKLQDLHLARGAPQDRHYGDGLGSGVASALGPTTASVAGLGLGSGVASALGLATGSVAGPGLGSGVGIGSGAEVAGADDCAAGRAGVDW